MTLFTLASSDVSNKCLCSLHVLSYLPSRSALYIKEGTVESKDAEFIRHSVASLQVGLQLTSQL